MDWETAETLIAELLEVVRSGREEAAQNTRRLDVMLERLGDLELRLGQRTHAELPRPELVASLARPADPADFAPSRPRRATLRDSPLADLFKATDDRRHGDELP